MKAAKLKGFAGSSWWRDVRSVSNNILRVNRWVLLIPKLVVALASKFRASFERRVSPGSSDSVRHVGADDSRNNTYSTQKQHQMPEAP